MKKNIPTILIIIGISGDLSRRKLLPAIGQIAAVGELPDQFRIVGITRQAGITVESLLAGNGAAADIKNLAGTKAAEYLRSHLELFAMDLLEPKDYARLNIQLEAIGREMGASPQRLFYLSVPPQVSGSIIELLGQTKLASQPNTKLLLEKPFGVDLASAQELVADINRYFQPEQIYRIDHYLAKETAQNLVVFRQDNSLFKRTWNKDFIDRIEITASETISINGRAVFYEQTGALRDFVQSHLLQLSALTLMDIPPTHDLEEIPIRRLTALRQLHLPAGQSVTAAVKRGQYRGYQKEANNPGSTVETFVSLTLESDDPAWAGVPIILTTGKALAENFTGIKIFYKKDQSHEANDLIMRLQPDAGIELCLWSKQPGYDHKVDRHQLRFSFQDHYQNLPEAYEQVLFNAISSDHSLFAGSEEVLETWRILDEIQRTWEMSADDLIIYEPGANIAEILAGK
jgi:glucose-6-phosphate 1-dehydrogenase